LNAKAFETNGDEPKERMGASQKFDYIFYISVLAVSGGMISRWRLQESKEIEGKLVPTKCLPYKWFIPKFVGQKENLIQILIQVSHYILKISKFKVFP